MNNKKHGFVPLFSIFQTDHPVLVTVIFVITIIVVAIFPILILPILIVAVVIGIIGLLGILAGLVDMNRESLQYRAAEHSEMIPDRPTHNDE
jgi:hypothetical protein